MIVSTEMWVQDDASALDMDTMVRWNLIMRVFMSEYLGLQPDDAHNRIKRDNGDLVSNFCASVICRGAKKILPSRPRFYTPFTMFILRYVHLAETKEISDSDTGLRFS